jgi:hypothetical protein
VSGVALAPSGGRAGGALLTLILHGSRLDCREDGSSCRTRACADPLRRSARCGRLPGAGARRRRRGPEGLRAARGARRATFPGLTPTSCRAGVAPRRSDSRADHEGRPDTARPHHGPTLASRARGMITAGTCNRSSGPVGRLGLEPRTHGLKVRCSTIELTPRGAGHQPLRPATRPPEHPADAVPWHRLPAGRIAGVSLSGGSA